MSWWHTVQVCVWQENWCKFINAINGSSAEVLTHFYRPSNMSCQIQGTFSFPLSLWILLGTLFWSCAIIQIGKDLWRSLDLSLCSKCSEIQSSVRLPGANSSTLTLLVLASICQCFSCTGEPRTEHGIPYVTLQVPVSETHHFPEQAGYAHTTRVQYVVCFLLCKDLLLTHVQLMSPGTPCFFL